ncbi:MULTISPECIES: hypothetical protein [Amycolatopsis]|uniref:hypothetical protein n=1 Tax=Amycolatopsis TaxID=1813 RepID=UPI0011776634|nr:MULTISPECIES: hypothetical protein [Amycolatopsis]
MVEPAEVDEELRDALLTYDAHRFTSHMLLDRVPWLWPDRASYVEWKSELAAGLDVDPYAIVVVGSACTGATLNPNKPLFSRFKETSDVDVAVISSHHFELAWKTLREIGRTSGQIPTRRERQIRQQHRNYLVFDGTIATDWILPNLPFGEQWRAALLAAERRLPNEQHEVKARIYRDLSDLRSYHVHNVEKLRKRLLAESAGADHNLDDGAPLMTDPEPDNESKG